MDLPDKSQPTPQKKVKAVIPAGAVTPVKRAASRRFLDYVFAESPKAMLSKVADEVLVPRAKSAMEEGLNAFVHGMLWRGGSAPTNLMSRGTVIRGGGVVINGGVDYNNLSNPAVLAAAASPGTTGPYQDLTFPSQQFAEAVLAELYSLLNQYSVVTVADLYEACNSTPEPNMSNYGWYGLDGSRITKERDGFRLGLPKPVRV